MYMQFVLVAFITWSLFVLVTLCGSSLCTPQYFSTDPTVVPAGQYQRQAPSRQMPRVIEHSRHIRTPRKGSLQKHLDSDEIRKAAIAAAREAETKAFSKADLSIQELLDCDTRYDQGCTGGNPLLAYYFIHRYGLTDSSQYPYKGKQKECKVDQVTSPIATAEGWGVLTPNHEENMELVLRYIGPIAVGVNGSEGVDFLAHEGGIFHSKKCGQNANHAMLIVGYGQETNKKTGKVTRYWIARNSWGTGWGEKGYVRMKRGSGKKGKRGVCGIARSPSVCVG